MDLPPGWIRQWSETHQRPFYVDTQRMRSSWSFPQNDMHLGAADAIDPGLLGHFDSHASDVGRTNRPYVMQGSLWSSVNVDPSSTSLLTPWQARESPTSSTFAARRSLSSDGGSTPSDLHSDDFGYPYRAETSNAFANDSSLLSSQNGLAVSTGRSHSPMLGYYDPTPTASHFSHHPSPMLTSSDPTDPYGAYGGQSLFASAQGMPMASAYGTSYEAGTSPYSMASQGFDMQQAGAADPYAYDMAGHDSFHY